MSGLVLWFTGLSGAGKSTIADLVGSELERAGVAVEYLDGDVVRTHLSKGLYRKARAGELRGFTGVDGVYEPPEEPEVRLDSATLSPEAAADVILDHLRANGLYVAR